MVGGFLVGVFVRSFVPLSYPFALFAALLAIVSLLFIFIQREKAQALILLSVVCAAFGIGMVRMDVAVQIGDPQLTALVGESVTIEGVVSKEPDVRENGIRLSLHATQLIAGSSTSPVSTGILVRVPPHTPVAYGDVVHATGVLGIPEAFDTGPGRSFDYQGYLAQDGILYELSFAEIARTGENRGNPVQAAAIGVKQLYLSGLQAVLPEPESGLAGGITVGDKRSIGPELSAQFQKVALIHMVVLSGYNITIVINSIGRALSPLPRTMRFAGSGLGVVFFVLMAGGAASAVRAGIMALLAMYARLSGRVFIALRALGVVAAGMVLWDPYTLAFDPSFQLSALATLGLISCTPYIYERVRWVPERFGLREIFASTIGTQLAVLPLLLYQNGNLSIVALPANLFALISVPLAMATSFAAALGGMLVGSYAVPLAFPAYIMLAYIIGVAELFAALPFASVTVPAFSAWWMCLAYGILFGGLWSIQKRRNRRAQGSAGERSFIDIA